MPPPGGLEPHVDLGTRGGGGRHGRRAAERGVHVGGRGARAARSVCAYDDDTVAVGADVGKAVDPQKRRDALQADLDGLWAEYDELDALLAVAA